MSPGQFGHDYRKLFCLSKVRRCKRKRSPNTFPFGFVLMVLVRSNPKVLGELGRLFYSNCDFRIMRDGDGNCKLCGAHRGYAGQGSSSALAGSAPKTSASKR